jgi:hypothetical protein
MINRIVFLVLTIFLCNELHAQAPLVQADSALTKLSSLPQNYLQTLSSKSEKYYNAVTSKTEKTLERLAKWEGKIKTILEKTSPETAQRLFGNDQLTFASLLQKYKEGKAAAENYRGQFNEYRDKVNTTLKYLDDKKEQLNNSVVKPLQEAKAKTAKLNEQLKNTEAVQQFIKERKKQLMDQAIQYLGKSKYLQKISKESYYYVETLRNYKEIFSDPKKTEELAVKLLNKIPGFSEFLRKNSMLASLFRSADSPPLGGAGGGALAGLQTRAQVNNLIQQQITAGGPNAQQQFQQNMQAAQAQLNELKNKILKAGGGSSDDAMPDGFKPNNQKSKTFFQRLEYGTTVQSQKGNSYWPNSTDLGMTLGYKLNDKSVIGIGASYKVGLGRGINHIRFTSEGAGLRSYIDWKIKGSFWISGGYEQNYRTAFSCIEALRDQNAWQKSGLIGISKKISLKTKFLKQTNVRLYWDFLSYQQVPRTQPVVFRVGYNF